MSNQAQSSNVKKVYDLEERTAIFGENVIEFIKLLPKTEINRPLINQIIKAATSIGANYMEADAAESGRDFKHKIGICEKEAKVAGSIVPTHREDCGVILHYSLINLIYSIKFALWLHLAVCVAGSPAVCGDYGASRC